MATRLRLLFGGQNSDYRYKIIVGPGETVIGRHSDCNLVIQTTYVGRRHAMIVEKNGHYFISDLNSTSGTVVNEKRITCPTQICDGDSIQVGGVKFYAEFSNANLHLEKRRGIGVVAIRPGFFDSLEPFTEPDPVPAELQSELRDALSWLPSKIILDLSRAGCINSRTGSYVWSLIRELQSAKRTMCIFGASGFSEFWKNYESVAPVAFDVLNAARDFLEKELPNT